MKFTPSISKNTKACFAVIARLIVSSHFIYELVDKISRYTHWKSIIESQAGLGAWSLWLIIVLLFLGSTSLVLGRYLGVGTFALCLFQIPTSIMFEDSLYESFDSRLSPDDEGKQRNGYVASQKTTEQTCAKILRWEWRLFLVT